MSDITTGEVAQLRGDMAREVFTEQVSVIHRTQPVDQATGRYTNTPVTVWTGPANRKPATETRQNSTLQVAGTAMQESLSYWEFSFPVGTPVVVGDRIQAVASGRLYDVLGVLDKSIQIALYVYTQERSSAA